MSKQRISHLLAGLVRLSVGQLPRCFYHQSHAGPWASARCMSTLTSPCYGSEPIRQRIYFSREDYNSEDLIDPVDYFKENQLLVSVKDNDLIEIGNRKNHHVVSVRAAGAFRSLAEIIAENHRFGIALLDAINLPNLRMSKLKGKFVFVKIEGGNLTQARKAEDYHAAAHVIQSIVNKVLGKEAILPSVFHDLLEKMKAADPSVRLILYHSLFFSDYARFWYRIMIDQRLRKEYQAANAASQVVLKEILSNLPYKGTGEGSLTDLAGKNELLGALLFMSRRFAKTKGAKAKPAGARTGVPNVGIAGRARISKSRRNTVAKRAAKRAKAGGAFSADIDQGRDLVALNRDILIHGAETSCKNFTHMTKDMITMENIINLLHFEFMDYESKSMSLFYSKGLWPHLGIEKLFGETPDTWKEAIGPE